MNPADGIRIASYNIRKCVGLDWRRRPDRILRVLDEIDADIVAVQEVDRRFGARSAALPREMIAEHGVYAVPDIAIRPASIGWHGNTVLVRKSTFSITHAERVEIPAFEPRGAVLVHGEAHGFPIRIVGAHLALLHRHRRLQLGALGGRFGRGKPTPTVILGDFNEWRRSIVIDGFTTTAPGHSFHARLPIAPLDRIMTSRELTVTTYGVHTSELARIASDHLPIWADISRCAAST